MAGQSLVLLTGQISFSPVIPYFWLGITGQNDRQEKDFQEQVPILAGHCLLTDHYFQPCDIYIHVH